ncbi:hypothetical protein DPMN_034413 [Dreissena polymorpha]|uniref:Uncharacterized protein n=1 Tax=Dreissena polymorpha TaxID=45954 RepID=A0A9D4M7H9_DREPO|nr:hypothetical protein DPMN_034410 [Dreissena polymorpha]KAH3871219.1 hypothetical protein DPMN_034413 [Dreissena polymorpha]
MCEAPKRCEALPEMCEAPEVEALPEMCEDPEGLRPYLRCVRLQRGVKPYLRCVRLLRG